MSNQLNGFVLQTNQGFIHKNIDKRTGFTPALSDAYLFKSVDEVRTFILVRDLCSDNPRCYQVNQQF